MKFCANCGILGRMDNLRKYHMKFCQPDLAPAESGFLLDGQLPNFNVQDFRAILRMAGCSVMGSETPQQQHTEVFPNDTESEDSGDDVSTPGGNNVRNEPFFS